jgi:hypothetical protein
VGGEEIKVHRRGAEDAEGLISFPLPLRGTAGEKIRGLPAHAAITVLGFAGCP